MFRNSAMICFKCGQQGHRADQCQSPERLCYNCREAGHESKDCEKPHDAESKCLLAPFTSQDYSLNRTNSQEMLQLW